MKEYRTMHLVKSEDLNVHGTLFAARASAWIVETAYIAAAVSHGDPGEVVCRSSNNIEFIRPVGCGDIINITGRIVHLGNSSIYVAVEVISELTGEKSVDGIVTFVTVARDGSGKKPHGLVMDPPGSEAEKQLREKHNAFASSFGKK